MTRVAGVGGVDGAGRGLRRCIWGRDEVDARSSGGWLESRLVVVGVGVKVAPSTRPLPPHPASCPFARRVSGDVTASCLGCASGLAAVSQPLGSHFAAAWQPPGSRLAGAQQLLGSRSAAAAGSPAHSSTVSARRSAPVSCRRAARLLPCCHSGNPRSLRQCRIALQRLHIRRDTSFSKIVIIYLNVKKNSM